MTNEDLLQQAKDQVAQDDGFKDFAHFLKKVPVISFGNGIRANLLQRAALLAIQRAREEAAPELLEALRGMVDHYEKFTANWNHEAYLKAKKLTAPGR